MPPPKRRAWEIREFAKQSQRQTSRGKSMEKESMEDDLERLIRAARCGDLDEVKNCVSAENLNREGPLRMTVFAEACRAGQKEVVRFLLRFKADVGDVLHLACEYKDVDMVMVMVTSGVPLDTVDKYGKTPLHVAVERQSVVVVEALLKHGALVDKVDRNRCQTPLHIACELECLDVVTSLLAFEARMDLKDTSSHTPLHIASANNKSLDVVLALLNHGAFTDESDRYGDAAVHKASERGRSDMVRLLLLHGASVNIPNRRRLTPLHLAFDHDPTIAILLDYGSGEQHCNIYSCPCKSTVLKCQYEFHRSTVTTVDVFERHFIKVEAANINYVGKFEWVPTDSERWKQPDRDKFRVNCSEEIEKMKTCQIGETNCSYYDLLCRKKTAFQNEKIVGTLSSDVLREFPIYGDMIYCSYLKIPEFLKRRELVEKSSSFFDLVQCSHLPPELVPLFLEYLSDVDLERLIEICKTSQVDSLDSSDHISINSHGKVGGVVDELHALSLSKCNVT